MTTAVPLTPRPEPAPAPRPNNLVGLGLLAGFVALGVTLALAPAGRTPLTFGFVILGWVLAVMAHEFAHAATAFLGGDVTVRDKGYLAFDPRRYGDLGVSLVIPLLALALGGIGFPGGAVYIRNDLIRSRGWRAASALAGPAATFAVLVVIALALRLGGSAATGPLAGALAMLAFLQAMALVLNLLPIPGLDGFNAIRPFLPPAWGPALRRVEGLTFLVLLAALFFVPGFSDFLFALSATIAAGLGVPLQAMQAGWDAFHFWR
jgi:Zn-dependent protease